MGNSTMASMNSFLDNFGSVTLSLQNLIFIQLIIMGIGMFIGGLSFLCVYEPKINGRLQSIIPIVQIKSLKKKIRKKKKKSQLAMRQQRDISKREKKGLMEVTTDTDYMTVQQDDDEDESSDDDDDDESHHHDHNNEHIRLN